MINLIKNELCKIFNKKSTYIIFVFIFMVVVFTNYLYKNKLDENGEFIVNNNINLNQLTQTLNELDLSKEENKNYELELRKTIIEYKLYDKYGENSWQAYIIQNEMNNLINNLIDKKYGDERNDEELQFLEKNYNFYIDKFEEDDWKYFVNEEIKIINNKMNELKNSNEEYENYELELEVLNYRLENNVSYAHSYLNTALNKYLNSAKIVKLSDIDYIEEQNKLYPKERHLYNYYHYLNEMNTNKYILDNKIDANKVNDNRGILLNLFTEYEMYIIIFILFITSSIVSSEFNNGTIKQLLLVPHSRKKILLSKYITCTLMILFIIILIIVMQLIVGTITFDISSLKIKSIVYNFNENSIQTYNIFYHLLIKSLAKMPMFVILMTLVFLTQILTLNNSISIIFGITMYILTGVVNEILLNTDIQVLNYLIFSHWDFTQYLFGTITINPYINIRVSIPLCILHLILSFVAIYIIFEKKDIKNI